MSRRPTIPSTREASQFKEESKGSGRGVCIMCWKCTAGQANATRRLGISSPVNVKSALSEVVNRHQRCTVGQHKCCLVLAQPCLRCVLTLCCCKQFFCEVWTIKLRIRVLSCELGVWGKVGCVWEGCRMEFHIMGSRRPLSKFLFGVALLIWMASTVLWPQITNLVMALSYASILQYFTI